jgi:rubrerythrin
MNSHCGSSEVIDEAGGGIFRPTTRAAFIRRATLLGAVAMGGTSFLGNASGSAGSTPSPAQDAKIFNFALALEYLQAGFYGEAVNRGRLKGEIREFAETVAQHERDHVDYLKKALGTQANGRPRFDFRGATESEQKFLSAAVLLENTGVAAYNGQVANLTKKAVAAAAAIVSVEGRHAAWISDLAGVVPAPHAADAGVGANEVLAIIAKAGFVHAT